MEYKYKEFIEYLVVMAVYKAIMISNFNSIIIQSVLVKCMISVDQLVLDTLVVL